MSNYTLPTEGSVFFIFVLGIVIGLFVGLIFPLTKKSKLVVKSTHQFDQTIVICRNGLKALVVCETSKGLRLRTFSPNVWRSSGEDEKFFTWKDLIRDEVEEPAFSYAKSKLALQEAEKEFNTDKN